MDYTRTKTLRVHPDIEHPGYPDGDVLIVQPDEDLVNGDPDEVVFELGETVNVDIPAGDGMEWTSTGKVVGIDTDDDPLLIHVRVHWGEATIKV
jgi:hypothetical protein